MDKALNQKAITVHKAKAGKNHFLLVSNESLNNASKRLSGSGFKMWCYFASNCDGVVIYPSGKIALDKIGIRETAYSSGIRNLQAAGFLHHTEGRGKTYFDFYEYPCEHRKENLTL